MENLFLRREKKKMKRIEELIRYECDSACDLLLTKNREYGNSAFQPMRIFSNVDHIEQLKVRIDDKISRIRTVGDKFEIKEDTVQDLIGYLILYRVAIRLQEEESCKL